MGALSFSKNQKFLIGIFILSTLGAFMFYFLNGSTHILSFNNSRTIDMGIQLLISCATLFYAIKLWKSKLLKGFSTWLMVSYILICIFNIICMYSSVYYLQAFSNQMNHFKSYVTFPLFILIVLSEIICFIVLLKVTKSFKKLLHCFFPIAITLSIFTLCAIYFINYIQPVTVEMILSFSLLTICFSLVLYLACAAKHPGILIIMIGQVLTFVDNFTISHHSGGYYIHPFINSHFFVTLFGYCLILIGIISLLNDPKLKRSQLLFKPNSINTLLPTTLTLISVVGAVLITFLPVYLSNYAVTLDPDLKGVFGAALTVYLIINLLGIKLVAYFTYRPINAFMNSMKGYFSGQSEAPVKKKYFAAEYAFVNRYVTKSIRTLQERDAMQHELNEITKMFSHDIKSPLSVIQYVADSNIKDPYSKKLVLNSVEKIKNVSSRILKYYF